MTALRNPAHGRYSKDKCNVFTNITYRHQEPKSW